MTGALVASVTVVALLTLTRLRNLSIARRANAARTPRPVDADGVIVGAEAIYLEGTSSRAVLILHGFNDTPQSVAALAHALNRRGWTVSAPRLPHHGRADNENAERGRADEWIEHARREWDSLRALHTHAVLAGQSMGGAIAVLTAASHAPTALVLLAPYFEMGRMPWLVARLWPATSLIMPTMVSDPVRGLRDADARAKGLGRGQFTPRLLNELRRIVDRARPALPTLHMPILYVQSRSDYRISPSSAQRNFNRLGSADKTLVWLTDVGHVVAADKGQTDVGALVGDWLDLRVPSA